ncbi:very-short-patch-repair endonuclease [Arcanobacterium wilhelmae]|uniref:Very-short-patch-repair endonuclease n=1 Tax=Arcanobacterium wilhelmae TaxID=1803177 RepID=A0ABT9NDR1_9ACTO|nr:DUF559 domain-containing protein [Arcanobacterium wilhelmae]MDP9801663.1 very-short-patch-repair endonuclease [Arcanobacterium wilhelmae]WFN90984.1 DUF559 domain-containing protein [Arcanobacterium wilhelmae]
MQVARRHLQIAGLTAAKYYKLWVPPGRHPTEVSTRPGTRRPRFGQATIRRWKYPRNRLVPPLVEVLEQVARWHSTETAAIVLESALAQGKASMDEVHAIIRRLPKRRARLLRFVDDRSGSGSETRLKFFFIREQIKFDQQFQFSADYRADFRLGKHLILEADSSAYHATKSGYLTDRRRDLEAAIRGFEVLRLSFEQIWTDWRHTKGVLRAIVRSRRHQRRLLDLTDHYSIFA